MDKEIVEQFASEILSYRIRARQKKRAIKAAGEKKLLQLHKESRQISKQLWNRGYVELNPPLVKGWKRYFILREDIARGGEGIFFQNILNKINTEAYCNRKDFKKKSRDGSQRKKWEPIRQTVLQPELRDFLKLNFSEKEKDMFEEKFAKHKWKKELVKIYVFKEPWRFVFRARQNIITKVKAIDIDLESRQLEIRDYLNRSNKGFELSHILGDSINKWRKNFGLKPKEVFKKKSVEEMIGLATF